MAEPSVRDRILQALEDLPPDATFDDAIERLVFLAKIDAGLAELDAGKGIPHDEAKRRLGTVKIKALRLLSDAEPFTEPTMKDGTTYYPYADSAIEKGRANKKRRAK